MVRVVGGEAGAVASLAPKCGPLGLVRPICTVQPAPQISSHSLQSPKKVADDIAKGTQDWKGQKVTCKLTVQNRVCKVEVIPSAAALLVKALKEPSRDRKKEKNSTQLSFQPFFPRLILILFTVKHNGNITMKDVIDVARTMRPRSQAKTFKGTVKEIVGTAVSVGCTIDGNSPKVTLQLLDDGKIEVPDK